MITSGRSSRNRRDSLLLAGAGSYVNSKVLSVPIRDREPGIGRGSRDRNGCRVIGS
jgi:hypothetical protein